MKELDIGIIGLGVMGQNLALNIADKGFTVAGWDAWPDPVESASPGRRRREPRARRSRPCRSWWRRSRRPRRIIMLVKAGEVVDKTIAALRPLLEHGRHPRRRRQRAFRNTERRAAELRRTGSASSAWASPAARRARATARR